VKRLAVLLVVALVLPMTEYGNGSYFLCTEQRPVTHLVSTEGGSAGVPCALHRRQWLIRYVCHTFLPITEKL